MNIEAMKTFCDLVESGSFSKAAEANYISQSAVSQQLAKLESKLNVQLISRGGGIVAPTDAGKAFYEGAKEILRRYESLLGEVRSARDTVRGVLRVGTIYSAGFYLLDSYIKRFLQAHPEVNLHVLYTGPTRIYADVIGGEMDLGVVAYPEKHRSVEIIPLTTEEMVMVCSPTHRLAKAGRVEPSELEGEKYVTFERYIPTRRHLDRLLKAEKVKMQVVMEFDNIETVKRAVEIGSGISILPLPAVERECERGDLAYSHLATQKKWMRPVGLIRRRGKTPTTPERMFLGLLRQVPHQGHTKT